MIRDVAHANDVSARSQVIRSPPFDRRDADAPDPIPGRTNLDGVDLAIIAALLALVVIVFANGLRGDFLFDDNRQIVRNELIRDPHRWAQALTHDVWAFLGERDDRPWSNYWRPGHVAWMILNVQLFGASDPLPWHITSLLAHLGVIAAAYLVLRQLGLSRGVTAAIAAIFAIHPTRCESVTWIAGVHDVLCALWQLLALLCVMSAWDLPSGRGNSAARAWRWAAAVFFYALAISTKEIAIFFPVILVVIRWTDPAVATLRRWRRASAALAPAAPFVLIAIAFLAARHAVLGRTQLDFPFKPSWGVVVSTLPLVIVTYLRQIVFPIWIGWTYPVRAVTAGQVGVMNFWLPLAIVAGLIAVAARLRWDRVRLIGLALFVLTLLPAMNLRALPPDSLVKDRYLYLPLLGFLMIVVPTIASALRRLGPKASLRMGAAIAGCAVALLAMRTMLYNRAWLSEIAMWEWSLWTDPTSASNHHQLGVALLEARRYPEARQQINQAIALERQPLFYLALSDVDLAQGRYDDATTAAQQAMELAPTDYRTHERLAVSFEKRGMLRPAEAALRAGIRQIPYRRAYFTDQLAVILYQQGRRDEALAELESAREVAESEYATTSRLVFFHLGMLYAERGRAAESRDALQKFMRLTDGSADPAILAARKTAGSALSAGRSVPGT